MALDIEVHVVDPVRNVVVVQPLGFIDTNTSDQMAQALKGIFAQERYRIIIDLQNVNFISSAGWGIFIGEIRFLREHQGDLRLASMQPEVEEIYRILEFDSIIRAYPTVEEALNGFK
jgi:anti-sigma B factor antagonist